MRRANAVSAVLALVLVGASAVQASAQAGAVLARQRFGPADSEMVWIPAGEGEIGCVAGDAECYEDEKPAHRVILARGFWLDVTEVTLAQYRRFAQATGRPLPPPPGFPQGESHPVVSVGFDDAVAYCSWAGGRLPTEAEWEYAARGGSSGWKYPWGGSAVSGQANAEGISPGDTWARTAPVASFPANGFGLFDMAGNAWEWCADFYASGTYRTGPAADPTGPATGTQRVLRGGAWNSQVKSLRASNRGKALPSLRLELNGFRCARDEAAQLLDTETTSQEQTSPASPSRLPSPAPTPPIPPPGSTDVPVPQVPEKPPAAAEPAPATALPAPLVATPALSGPAAPPPGPALEAPPPPAPLATAAVLAVGERRRFAPSSTEMTWIPAAVFERGCVTGDNLCDTWEQFRRRVTITRGFWIDVKEVTVASFRSFCELTGRQLPRQPFWNLDHHPVVEVTWEDAAAYCSWAGGRLPREAEWECAARGGQSGLRYPWGKVFSSDQANGNGTGGADVWEKTSPVGSFPPNGVGLFDVAGNVWEWCADYFDQEGYPPEDVSDPAGPPNGETRVLRGGSWTSNSKDMRSSARWSERPSMALFNVGFRCVRDAAP
jgi:sulfatase modifying factor 1